MADDLNKRELMRTDMVLRALWRNWAVAYGAITLPLLLALFVPRIWIPFICLGAGYLLLTMMRSDVNSGVSSCSLIIRLASRILLIASAAMFVVVILCTDWLVPTVVYLDLYNSEIPFITCLVIFPVTALACGISLATGMGIRICRHRQRQNGFYAGDSIVATLYYKESKYQAGILMILGLLLGAVEYWYYFARYINANLNEPDRFFFNYMPLAMYLLSLMFMAGRYASMHTLYRSLEEANPGHVGSTIVRFLIFCGDDLVLHCGADGRWDTPAEMIIGHTHSIGDPKARLLLGEQTGLDDFTLRYCYTNEGFVRGSNMIHYAAFIDEKSRGLFGDGDEWFNAYMLDNALAANMLAPSLANELYRIHTMTMAWKTYDRNGRRLYPIKHYRPTFRFRDMAGWDVDYDDRTWFDIASNNEDRSFFRTRQFWNRLINVFRPKGTVADEP